MVGLSAGEKHFIQGGIAQDLRTDGRKRLDFRPISVETGIIPQASGSARVRIGATDVIASVKAELGKPNASQPDKGKVSIHVDCSATAEPAFEGRGVEELSAELSVSLQRCLLGGKSGSGAGINLSSLIIVEGKVCWDLYIDGLVVSSDGNLLDALGAAIKSALSNTGIPKVQVSVGASGDEQPEVDVSDEEFLQFDTSGIPIIVTLTKIGRHYIVDATSEEESQMSSAVSMSINRRGHSSVEGCQDSSLASLNFTLVQLHELLKLMTSHNNSAQSTVYTANSAIGTSQCYSVNYCHALLSYMFEHRGKMSKPMCYAEHHVGIIDLLHLIIAYG